MACPPLTPASPPRRTDSVRCILPYRAVYCLSPARFGGRADHSVQMLFAAVMVPRLRGMMVEREAERRGARRPWHRGTWQRHERQRRAAAEPAAPRDNRTRARTWVVGDHWLMPRARPRAPSRRGYAKWLTPRARFISINPRRHSKVPGRARVSLTAVLPPGRGRIPLTGTEDFSFFNLITLCSYACLGYVRAVEWQYRSSEGRRVRQED